MKATTMIKGLAATAILTLPMSAFAVGISGELGIAGALAPTCNPDPAPADCTMDIANGLTFAPTMNQFSVTFATGDFAADGLGFLDVGDINDFQFNPLSPSPVDPLWTIMGDALTWSFALESVNIIFQSAEDLVLEGTGTLSGTGYDDTMGFWSLSTDSANNDMTFSWSSTTVAAVPEPGILVLLGMGLIGVFGLRRLRS